MTTQTINRSLEGAINQLLVTNLDFCPTTERLDRYDKMPISDDLKQALRDRYTECWVAFSEEEL